MKHSVIGKQTMLDMHPACALQAAMGSPACRTLPGGHDYLTGLGLQMLLAIGVAGWLDDSQKAHAGHECGDGAVKVPLVVDLGRPGNLQLLAMGLIS